MDTLTQNSKIEIYLPEKGTNGLATELRPIANSLNAKIEYESREKKVKSEIVEMFPKLSKEELAFIENLPSNFLIENVPYFQQEEKHLCGAAVAQMIYAFWNEKVPSQKNIAFDAGWNDWNNYDHSTYREKLGRYFLKNGFLFSQFYPMAYIGKSMEDGFVATEYIRENYDILSEFDYLYFKALLVSRNAPIFARVHFTEKEYPMEEAMMEKLDFSGHCLLIVGYDDEGFICHDPWKKEEWGGTEGGELWKLPFWKRRKLLPFCDGCCDFAGAIDKLQGNFLAAKEAVYVDKEILLELELSWAGVSGILLDWYKISNFQIELNLSDRFTLIEDLNKDLDNLTVSPGQKIVLKWKINCGKSRGSFPVNANITASIKTPKIPWENHSEEVNSLINLQVKGRVYVFERSFLEKYGKGLWESNG